MTIPHRLIADSIGPCDGTPLWWELWTDIITRSPAFDDEANNYDAYAASKGIDKQQVFAAFSHDYARSSQPLLADRGPLIRYPYRSYEADNPTPSDYCCVGGACIGSCREKNAL